MRRVLARMHPLLFIHKSKLIIKQRKSPLEVLENMPVPNVKSHDIER
jgi:hypothetical protein